jgi:hypothetical protein
MARKSDDKAPGYDATGYIGAAGYVLMTYRVSGLTTQDQRERAAAWLWTTFKRGTEEQRDQLGPRVEGDSVVYTFLTHLHGKEIEGGKTAEVQTSIAKALNKPAKAITVEMTHEPAPTAPPPLAGVDAPLSKLEAVNAA